MREKLCETSVLVHPDHDKEYKLYTDASDRGLGAVLCQENNEGKNQVIAYAVRSLNDTEKGYPTIDKEALAVRWAIEKFRHYLRSWKEFKVYIDHAALKTLME